jgi:hypothetical protein
VSRYAITAQVLRMIASSPERVVHSGSDGDPIKHALRVAADACEQVDRAEVEQQEATIYAAQLWYLLDRASDILDTQPNSTELTEDEAWDAWTLVNEIRLALRAKAHAAGRLLLEELCAARVAVRAANALIAAQRGGDPEEIRRCLAAFEQTSCAYQEAMHRPVIAAEEKAAP